MVTLWEEGPLASVGLGDCESSRMYCLATTSETEVAFALAVSGAAAGEGSGSEPSLRGNCCCCFGSGGGGNGPSGRGGRLAAANAAAAAAGASLVPLLLLLVLLLLLLVLATPPGLVEAFVLSGAVPAFALMLFVGADIFKMAWECRLAATCGRWTTDTATVV